MHKIYYFLIYWISSLLPKQPVYYLHYTRYNDTTKYSIILTIGCFGIHFVDIENCGSDYTTDFALTFIKTIWLSFYDGSKDLVYCADEALLKIFNNANGNNGIKYYLISSPKIVNNNKRV